MREGHATLTPRLRRSPSPEGEGCCGTKDGGDDGMYICEDLVVANSQDDYPLSRAGSVSFRVVSDRLTMHTVDLESEADAVTVEVKNEARCRTLPAKLEPAGAVSQSDPEQRFCARLTATQRSRRAAQVR